ncbi:MAG: tetratricopeptide repeat protein [Verrucomicrobia bacterium]|jgi:predicted negative regulator of RcsB-dependent stress response|nr:tetratricopeptide repeat protein [Verrucomicrobiota bacterium]MBT7066973.1 tetratricopeptide repeat protein [Verrucomicrobiota bacterium]MBT7699996.1 tetratricopeptide repeat protein [Verrucomicrobiota bacterium]
MEPTQEELPEGGIEELEQLKHFWADHGTKITIVLAVVAVAVAGTNMVKSRRQGRLADASAQLGAARSAQDLEAIVADYGSTPSAPLALLQLGKTAYDGGDFNGAMTHYETFAQRYRTHDLASVAEMGLIHCREARGELDQAEAAFKAFAAATPEHFMAAQALLGQARCLEQLGRFDDARVVLEDLIAARADTAWGDRASEELETLEERRETYLNPPPVAVAPVNLEPVIIPSAVTAPVEPIVTPAAGE